MLPREIIRRRKCIVQEQVGFLAKRVVFGSSSSCKHILNEIMTTLAKAHLQLFSHLLFTPSVNHPERVVDAPPGASVGHQRRCTGRMRPISDRRGHWSRPERTAVDCQSPERGVDAPPGGRGGSMSSCKYGSCETKCCLWRTARGER